MAEAMDTGIHLDQNVEDEVTIHINEIIQDCGDGLSPECCIYRVPITLRHLKEEAYTPKVVSIGPFHYGNERLQVMERHKRILFKKFIQRVTATLDDLVRFVKDLLPKIRASYSETIELHDEQLVELTLMDAGFIIELFIAASVSDEVDKDPKLSQPWLAVSIVYDLVLLENQLPFFVIEELYNRAFPHVYGGSVSLFLRLTYAYFWGFNIQNIEPNSDVKINHFTDLFRLFYLPRTVSQRHPLTSRSQILLYNAKSLQEAGIKFKVSRSTHLLDLKFSGYQLEIPQILVKDSTEILFRNMIALEQCHYHYNAYITDYAAIMDCLVDSYKDVDHLVDRTIIHNSLGETEKVASLFNGLLENVTLWNFSSEYLDICKRLNGYYEDPWHKRKVTLRRDYCPTPDKTAKWLLSFVLLYLAVIQTVASILQITTK